jgi:hypothetical protein
MSDNAQIGGAITAIYRRNMGTMIERWEWHITAAGPDVAPGVSEEELARFRGQVSNPDNVRQYLKRWEGVEEDVEEGLRKGEEGKGGMTIPTILRLSFQMTKTKTMTMMRMKWQISSVMMKMKMRMKTKMKRLFRRMKD